MHQGFHLAKLTNVNFSAGTDGGLVLHLLLSDDLHVESFHATLVYLSAMKASGEYKTSPEQTLDPPGTLARCLASRAPYGNRCTVHVEVSSC